MFILISLFAGFTAFFSLYAFAQKQKTTSQYKTIERLQNLSPDSVIQERSKSQSRIAVLMATRDLSQLSFAERIIQPILLRLQDFFLQLTPAATFQTVRRYIIFAGKQDVWNANIVIFAWGMIVLGFLFVGIMVFASSDLALIQRVMILLMSFAIGIMFPWSYFRAMIRERQERIVMQLPPFLDLLTVSVQAGLSFDAALERILRRMRGPLIDEFKRVQRDMRLGLTKREALREMARRCDVEEIYLFVTSVIQAERLGTSLGKTLVDQAANVRERYQQRIKAQALKAPIKILFPLVLFIFPTIFIIVLVPPLIDVLNNLQIMPQG